MAALARQTAFAVGSTAQLVAVRLYRSMLSRPISVIVYEEQVDAFGHGRGVPANDVGRAVSCPPSLTADRRQEPIAIGRSASVLVMTPGNEMRQTDNLRYSEIEFRTTPFKLVIDIHDGLFARCGCSRRTNKKKAVPRGGTAFDRRLSGCRCGAKTLLPPNGA